MVKKKKKAHLSTQKKCTRMGWKNFPSCITNSAQKALPQIEARFRCHRPNIPCQQLSQSHLIMEDAHALHVTPMRGWICSSSVCPRSPSTVTFRHIKTGSSRGLGEKKKTRQKTGCKPPHWCNAAVIPHAEAERLPKKKPRSVFFKSKNTEEASVNIAGGRRQGTLQQLVWIIRGVGGSWLAEVEGRQGDSWRQDGASRSGRMTITKTLAGSHSRTERGCSWLTPLTATGWAGEWMTVGGAHKCVWVCMCACMFVSERERGTLLLPLPMR